VVKPLVSTDFSSQNSANCSSVDAMLKDVTPRNPLFSLHVRSTKRRDASFLGNATRNLSEQAKAKRQRSNGCAADCFADCFRRSASIEDGFCKMRSVVVSLPVYVGLPPVRVITSSYRGDLLVNDGTSSCPLIALRLQIILYAAGTATQSDSQLEHSIRTAMKPHFSLVSTGFSR